MPTTTNYSFGDRGLVPFPFTDQTTTKKRPAIVVSSSSYNLTRPDLILIAITSRIRAGRAIDEVVIVDWERAGLLKLQ
ncbi:MAG: mRNA interferase MazF [Acidobacteriota bacterium]|jgi:mRNA interferase MazF|nr:mRNA interferase MazF [Acidobacteriota bacterium]